MDNPKILYKYLTIDGAIATLENHTIKYSPPNAFNDPFEFRPCGYTGDTEEERIRICNERLKNDIKYRQVYKFLTGNDFTEKEWNELINNSPEIIKQLANKIFDDLQNRDWGEFVDRCSERYCCSCFSSQNNNILMWSHYAEMHRGMIIGFDSSKLSNIYPISYSNCRIKLPLSSTVTGEEMTKQVIQLITTKSQDWAYEKEWRSLEKISNLKKIETNKDSFYTKKFDPKSVVEIYLGIRNDNKLHTKVQEHVLDFPNCKYYIGSYHQTDFSINFAKM